MTYAVTYDIVTPESAEHGEAQECGFIDDNIKSLREAIDYLFQTRTASVDGVIAIEDHGRWVTVHNGMEYLTGANESRSLHFPENITESSRKRILSLIGA